MKLSIRGQVERYIEDVTNNPKRYGELERLTVARHLSDLKRSDGLFTFDAAKAEYAIEFLELCPQSKGEWAHKPLELHGWQKFIIWCLWGWRRVSDGFRRFRKALISVARKNGKSTLCAAIGILCGIADEPPEHGGEIYIAATKEQQARIIHTEAKNMVAGAPWLKKRSTTYTKSILFTTTNTTFQPLGSDSDTLDGLNPSCVLKDELHAWREHHRGLHEKLSTGGASRRQPIEIIITTAGDDRSTLWIEEDEYAERVLRCAERDEQIGDTYFAYIARIDKDDDPLDESVWPKANPNLGVSVRLDYLREQAQEAANKPAALNSFTRYHCNRMVSSNARVIEAGYWSNACDALDPESLIGAPCWGGFDLGRSDDFASLAMTFELEPGRTHSLTRNYTTAERREELRTAEVQHWIDRGDLIEHAGNQVNMPAIEADLCELGWKYGVRTWAYDPVFALHMAQLLLNEHGFEVFKFNQTARFYNEPIRKLLAAIIKGQHTHEGNLCTDWQAGNLTVKPDPADRWMPDKSHPVKKIDAMVSTLMSYSEYLFNSSKDLAPALY